MLTIAFFAFTTLQLFCFILALRNFLRTRLSYDLLPVLVIFGLVYDNFVIASGSFVGEGDLLKNLNMWRYVLHALLTPLLIIWGFGMMRRMGFQFAQSARNHAIFCLIATAMILLGAYSDILRLSLELKVEEGLTRYVNVGGIKGPPIPSIVTIFVLIGFGVMLWRKTKSWGLAAGSIFMLVAAMAGLRIVGLSNLGEVALSAGLLSGEKTTLEQGEKVGRVILGV
jgi:hypothetical protein